MGALKRCGFGGVEVVTLSGMPSEILKGEDDWGTENWNHMVEGIADTLGLCAGRRILCRKRIEHEIPVCLSNLTLERLLLWRELAPSLETFAGRGTYTGSVTLGAKDDTKRHVLRLGNVSNLYNSLAGSDGESDAPFQVKYLPRNYGIWETEDRKCSLLVIE